MHQFPYAFKWLLIGDLFILICRHISDSFLPCQLMGWLENILTASQEYPRYDTKQSDGEAPVMLEL